MPFCDHIDNAVRGMADSCFLYAYKASPIAFMNESNRGWLIEAIIKHWATLNTHEGYELLPAVVDEGRNAHNTQTDFRVKNHETNEDKSFEVKNARLAFDTVYNRWCLQWRNVKVNVADVVMLVYEDDDRLLLYQFDKDKPGYSTNGVATATHGGKVTAYGPCNVTNPLAAYNALVKKLEARYTKHYEFEFGDEPWKSLIASWPTTRGATAMDPMPLSMLSSVSRGNAAERLVRIALKEHGCIVEDAPMGVQVNGASTGRASTPCDFIVDSQRAESKSAMMNWDVTHKRWRVVFVKVQKAKHDVLYLSFFSPTSMHIVLYDHRVRETRTTTLAFHGECNNPCVRSAEQHILKNLAKWHGLTYIARVDFYDGDKERVVQVGMTNPLWNPEAVVEQDEDKDDEDEDDEDEDDEDDEDEDEDEDEEDEMSADGDDEDE